MRVIVKITTIDDSLPMSERVEKPYKQVEFDSSLYEGYRHSRDTFAVAGQVAEQLLLLRGDLIEQGKVKKSTQARADLHYKQPRPTLKLDSYVRRG